MTKLEINLKCPDSSLYYGDNTLEDDLINIYLEGFKCRKNISHKTLAKKLNYYHLCELVCLLRQKEDGDGFTYECEKRNYTGYCSIEKMLSEMGVLK